MFQAKIMLGLLIIKRELGIDGLKKKMIKESAGIREELKCNHN